MQIFSGERHQVVQGLQEVQEVQEVQEALQGVLGPALQEVLGVVALLLLGWGLLVRMTKV